MDTLLLSITGVALAVAAAASLWAWRVVREANARSAARVAALSAAAADANSETLMEARVHTIDLATESRRAAEERPWQPVAVNAPRPAPWASAKLSTFPSEAGERATERRRPDPPEPIVTDRFLGSAVARPEGGRQRGLAIAACVLFGLMLAGGYWVYGPEPSAVAAAAVTDAQPLELVSLRHERTGNRLSIAGLVRNPGSGALVERLTAVVFLFDAQGGFLTSARAGIDFTSLPPGDESPFVVSLDGPPNVARYRVSFRTDAGVVAHVDKRGQDPLAKELP